MVVAVVVDDDHDDVVVDCNYSWISVYLVEFKVIDWRICHRNNETLPC